MIKENSSILVVDDSKTVNEFLQHHLKEFGFKLLEAAYSGEEAIQLAQKNEPNLILMDIELPGKFNGIETVYEIKKFCDAPVIFLTSLDNREILNKIKELGAAFTKKPLDINELEVNIEIALEKHRLLKRLNQSESELKHLNNQLSQEVKNKEYYEKQILKSKQLYYSSFNALNEIVFVIDSNYKIILENQSFKKFAKQLGLKQELVGKSITLLEEYSNRFNIMDYEQIFHDGKEIFHNKVNIGNDSTYEIRKSPVFDQSNKVLRIITTIKDITALTNAESKLIKSEKKLRDLMEFLPEMICEVDLRGNILYANQFALKKLNYSNEEIENGMNIFQIFSPEEKNRAISNFNKRIEGKLDSAEEYIVETKDLKKIHVLIYANPILEKGKLTGFRGVMIDITKRKITEEELKESLITTETILENLPFGIIIVDNKKEFKALTTKP
ncbi:MAG: PAS domain S-box protein [Bacteroidales bacterium]|nr:PAS domain S-box protein [Bacteroidales bacterium]